MAIKLSPKQLQSLMTYDPRTGDLYWKERTPEIYMEATGVSLEAAERSYKWFNSGYAGKRVGVTSNGGREYVRISIGGDASNNTRRSILDLIWIVATGKEPHGHVCMLNKNLRKTPDNIVCFSPHTEQLFREPRTGIYRNAGDRTYFWRLYVNKELIQQGGYTTIVEARAARDARMKALGLWQEDLLSQFIKE